MCWASKPKWARFYLHCTPCEKTVMLCFRAQVYNNIRVPLHLTYLLLGLTRLTPPEVPCAKRTLGWYYLTTFNVIMIIAHYHSHQRRLLPETSRQYRSVFLNQMKYLYGYNIFFSKESIPNMDASSPRLKFLVFKYMYT